MRKKLLAGFLVASSLALVGCGNAAEESADVTEEVVETAEAVEEAAGSLLDPDTEYVFGTATLTYAEFYSGDVSSTDDLDAVASVTTGKYEIFPNMDTDFVDEETNAEGYNILGVKNVNVAVPADEVEEFKSINDSFVENDGEAPAQYKVVSVADGVATYSATNFAVADTVEDATAELLTGTVWGDYQINVIENSTAYIKNTRDEGDFTIDSNIQGIILETESGLKVGMEYLQSVWVQPYEISFNIEADNTHNQRVSFDNLAELSKLEEENVVSITFINQNDAYVYTFDGIYIKPVYRDAAVTGSVDEKAGTFAVENVPTDLTNSALTITYVVGEGKEAVYTEVYNGEVADSVNLDADALAAAKAEQSQEGSFVAVVSSDNYADIAVTVE